MFQQDAAEEGPSTAPPANAPVHTAMAVRRWPSSRNMLRIRDSVDGIRVAPPRPSRALVKMSREGSVASEAATEARPKTTAPAISRRLRPIRSPSDPIVRSSPARTNG